MTFFPARGQHKTSRKVSISLCILLVALCNVAVGQNQAPTNSPQNVTNTNEAQLAEEIRSLIQSLGSNTFEGREVATAELLKIGPPSLSELKKVTPSNGLERYQRATALIERIEKDRFDKVSRSFLLSRTPEKFDSLPGWRKFAGIAGTSRTSRLLYLDALKANPSLLQFIDGISEQLSDSEKESLQKQIMLACEVTEAKRMRLIEPSIGDLSAILFAACLIEQPLPIDGSIFVVRSIELSPFPTYLRKRGYDVSLKKMLNRWIGFAQPIFDYQILRAGLRWNLEESAETARRNLVAKESPDRNIQRLAIHNLCRFGDKSDVPRLIDLLNDATIVDRYREAEIPEALREKRDANPRQSDLSEDERFLAMRARWVVRVKDLAFAAALILNEEDPLEFLPNFQWDPTYGFRKQAMAIPEMLSSPSDRLALETRENVIEEWLKNHQSQEAKGSTN